VEAVEAADMAEVDIVGVVEVAVEVGDSPLPTLLLLEGTGAGRGSRSQSSDRHCSLRTEHGSTNNIRIPSSPVLTKLHFIQVVQALVVSEVGRGGRLP